MSKTKESLRDRLAKKRKEIQKSNTKGNIVYLKEGSRRVRILPTGEENDWALECTTFYLNKELKGVISPSTFGESCPIMELHEELKESKRTADKNMAKTLSPKKKYYAAVLLYKDERGKEIDEESGIKLIQLTPQLYGELIDHFLSSEWGDFTDPEEGYDVTLTRTGSGKLDTVYTMSPCKNTSLPPSWVKKLKRKPVDLEELVKASIPDYDALVEMLAEFQVDAGADEDEDERPHKKNKDKKHSRRNRDMEEE